MKKMLFSLLLIFPLLLQAQVTRKLQKTIELKMPKTVADNMAGTRGASVVWIPSQKKYYAAFAGNGEFPLAVFDKEGMRLSEDNLTCLIDVRGLWYNPNTKNLCGNAYGDLGWFRYTLDKKGIPTQNEVIYSGMNQPEGNSIGVYSPVSNKVYFLYESILKTYNTNGKTEESKNIQLYPGAANRNDADKMDDENFENYSSVLIYTGIEKAEFGLLNTEKGQVELYDQNTGLMTMQLQLPSDIDLYTAFNFSYANGIYWVFNQDTRTWIGFK